MTKQDEIRQVITSSTPTFKPFAYFDKHMDCIRVLIRDVSVTEVRMGKFITLLKENHRTPFSTEHVGFTIKGVAHLFHEAGLTVSGVRGLEEILDAIVKAVPHAAVKKVAEEFSPVLRAEEIKVSFDEPELLAA
jgi:hypothetical protein